MIIIFRRKKMAILKRIVHTIFVKPKEREDYERFLANEYKTHKIREKVRLEECRLRTNLMIMK